MMNILKNFGIKVNGKRGCFPTQVIIDFLKMAQFWLRNASQLPKEIKKVVEKKFNLIYFE